MGNSNKILLMQTAIADYRDHFVKLLNDKVGSNLNIMVGECYFDDSTKTSSYVKSLENVQVIRNVFYFNRKLCFQFVNLREVLTAEVVVFELNPHLISNWIYMPLRAILGRKNVLWGHAWSRSGKSSKTEFFRYIMRLMADNLLLYTEEQRVEIIERYPKFVGRAYVAPNSLYRVDDMVVAAGSAKDVVYVGRLVSKKKVSLLISAFADCLGRDDSRRLHIVGSGPEHAKLVSMVDQLSLINNVKFYGHISDLNDLENIYGASLMSVSPGYVGLSITQSFAFGRPMLIAENEPHSPELEAFVDGENGFYFESDNVKSLSEAMIEMFDCQKSWEGKFDGIVEKCKKTYSVQRMVRGFLDAVEH